MKIVTKLTELKTNDQNQKKKIEVKQIKYSGIFHYQIV